MKIPDSVYAELLNRIETSGDLPARRTPPVRMKVNGHRVDVSLPNFLRGLRDGKRTRRPEQGLVDALERHGLEIYCDPNGTWRLPLIGETPNKVTDDTYAVLLDSLKPGDLPYRHEAGPWDLGNGPVSIALGVYLHNFSQRGHGNEPEQILVKALKRHGLTPYQEQITHRWKIPAFSTRNYSSSSLLLVRNQSPDGVPGPSDAAGPASERETYSEMFGDINTNDLNTLASQYLDQVQYSHPMENPVGSYANEYLPADWQVQATPYERQLPTTTTGSGWPGPGQEPRNKQRGPGRG